MNATLANASIRSYPTFVDAVRDLDDALCMINLFANMPQQDSKLGVRIFSLLFSRILYII